MFVTCIEYNNETLSWPVLPNQQPEMQQYSISVPHKIKKSQKSPQMKRWIWKQRDICF